MPEPTQEAKDRIKDILAGKVPADVLQTTKEIRLLAESYTSWGDSPDLLFLIIRNPKCDKGTALYIYWLSDPVSFFELYEDVAQARAAGDWCGDYYHLLVEIQERYIAGFYIESDFHVKPEEIVRNDFTSDALKTPIPDVMRQPC